MFSPIRSLRTTLSEQVTFKRRQLPDGTVQLRADVPLANLHFIFARFPPKVGVQEHDHVEPEVFLLGPGVWFQGASGAPERVIRTVGLAHTGSYERHAFKPLNPENPVPTWMGVIKYDPRVLQEAKAGFKARLKLNFTIGRFL